MVVAQVSFGVWHIFTAAPAWPEKASPARRAAQLKEMLMRMGRKNPSTEGVIGTPLKT